jgi:lysophospholipase L1-like esterase
MQYPILRILSSLVVFASLVNAADFLLIGDSMAEAVDKPLERRFAKTTHTYSSFFKRGTTVDYWINNPQLYTYVQQRHPNYVLISLGTNDIVAQKTNERIISDLHILITSLSENGVNPSTIVIIAPPIPNDNNLNEALQVAFGDYVFPSKSRMLELKGDHIHPTPASNERWSDEIFYYLSPVINPPSISQ